MLIGGGVTGFCNQLQQEAWVIADLHFGDTSLCAPGKRPFVTAHAMDEELVRRWNDIVSSGDTVYILGDVGRGRHAETARRLNGCKHLVAGNGDDLISLARSNIFDTISVARWLPGALLTHIPVHPSQLRARSINVHGHTHTRSVGHDRHVCVSAELVAYTPVRLADLLTRRL